MGIKTIPGVPAVPLNECDANDGMLTIQLPAPDQVPNARIEYLKTDTSGNEVAVFTDATQIASLLLKGDRVMLYSDGVAWYAASPTLNQMLPSVVDSLGVAVMRFEANATVAAVNNLVTKNAATGTPVVIATEGTDTDVDLNIQLQGAGRLLVNGSALVGSAGPAGPFGGAIALPYVFSTTTTDSDPGSGNLRLSNATQNAATAIRVDLLDSLGTTWTTVIDTFDDSTSTIKGYIRLTKTSDQTKWLLFSVSAVDSSSGYRNIAVSNVGSSGSSPFSNADAVTLTFTRTGDKGTTGPPGAGLAGVPIDSTALSSAIADFTIPEVHSSTAFSQLLADLRSAGFYT